jgi:hypothetical protein
MHEATLARKLAIATAPRCSCDVMLTGDGGWRTSGRSGTWRL